MSEYVLPLILLTALTGVGGLALGGLLATLFRRESPKTASLLLSFTAGLMTCIVSLDLVPESFDASPNPYIPPLCLIGGFLVTYLLNCWIDKSVHHSDDHHPHACACGHHDLHTAGMILAAAVALHNMPVGMAIGTTVAVHGICSTSILAAVTIGMHNIPEGMSIAIPLIHDGSKAWKAVGLAGLTGLPTILGALLGFSVGATAHTALAVALGIAAGAMLYVIFFELLPEAYRQWQSKWAILATVLGFALGALLLFATGHNHMH